ncbi:predicted protein [Sclerotinia sclerotiorum 1980 UF-70]|uniref:BTB domain-containing protein n=2 Tax=Sclerotinia sclerotiorum (strain ATCC 18683 / 1980 / Ss-1) TaxID=665079 RepID=A7F2E1_SCLS1|nr:predicted protein [Sclerotinia sclerotiorum 1980 UF-70]APA09303.1 hypothetical protein sscle_05g040730 [Sclerotinia sclerotiorum 1980 UF-70]EDN95883.1 predicted protein [Sclerotinia sclerotiorum 1980 UF-70]
MTSSIPTERDADGNAKKAMKPIILQHPGFENDIRLNVFGQEYHAHPIILKLNSAYFRKFLDSADKVPAVKRSLFSYDYVTVVDADGEWSLEAVKSSPHSLNHPSTNNPKAPRTESSERSAFETLLFVFYNRPYIIGSYDCFMDIYRLADFYCALPAFSHSLDSAA